MPVEHHRGQPFDDVIGEPQARVAHRELTRVASGREVGHSPLAAHVSHHADQCVLLHPHFGAIFLALPQVLRVVLDLAAEEVSGAIPRGGEGDLAGAVLHRVPIADAGVSGIDHGAAEQVVVLLRVGEQVARNELVVELAKGQLVAAALVLLDDRIGLVDHLRCVALEASLNVDLVIWHSKSPVFCVQPKVGSSHNIGARVVLSYSQMWARLNCELKLKARLGHILERGAGWALVLGC
jgi:hypothetical protein